MSLSKWFIYRVIRQTMIPSFGYQTQSLVGALRTPTLRSSQFKAEMGDGTCPSWSILARQSEPS